VVYHQPTDTVVPPPWGDVGLTRIPLPHWERGTGDAAPVGCLVWPLSRDGDAGSGDTAITRAVGDWGYAIDLSGSVYRVDVVRRLMATARSRWRGSRTSGSDESVGLAHPNRLEVTLNAAFAELARGGDGSVGTLMACPDGCWSAGGSGGDAAVGGSVVVVTVNRVQAVYDNPVYAVLDRPGDHDTGSVPTDPHALTAWWLEHAAWRMDVGRYAATVWGSVHVGEWWWRGPDRVASDRGSAGAGAALDLISVVLPVHNARRHGGLRSAVASIECQADAGWELVIVDDGSDDGTADDLAQLARGWCHPQRLVIVRLADNAGVGTGLNAGLHHARGTIIARQDSDDVSHPTRLLAHRGWLGAHAGVDIVGSSVALVPAGTRDPWTHDKPLTIWGFAQQPAASALACLFHCPLAHPSVCFRRSVVAALASTSDAAAPPAQLVVVDTHASSSADSAGARAMPVYHTHRLAEDWDAWLRAAWPGDGTTHLRVSSIGAPLVALRSTAGSVTAVASVSTRSGGPAAIGGAHGGAGSHPYPVHDTDAITPLQFASAEAVARALIRSSALAHAAGPMPATDAARVAACLIGATGAVTQAADVVRAALVTRSAAVWVHSACLPPVAHVPADAVARSACSDAAVRAACMLSLNCSTVQAEMLAARMGRGAAASSLHTPPTWLAGLADVLAWVERQVPGATQRDPGLRLLAILSSHRRGGPGEGGEGFEVGMP